MYKIYNFGKYIKCRASSNKNIKVKSVNVDKTHQNKYNIRG